MQRDTQIFLIACASIVFVVGIMLLAFDKIDALDTCQKHHSAEVCQHELNR